MRTTEAAILGFGAVAAGLLVLVALAPTARGGFWALPLEAEVDRAETVVLGKLVRVEPTGREHEGRMTYARGVIAARETLKGSSTPEISVNVVSALGGDLAEQMQSPPRVCRLGQEGIWIIVDGKPSHGYGLLPESRLEEVRAILKRLAARTWSDEVGGLKAWAGLVHDSRNVRLQNDRPGGLVFAVRNVSERTIYVPRSLYSNVMRTVAEDGAGRTWELRGVGDRIVGEAPLVCRPLEPGETRYMHADGEDYGYIIIPEALPPGRYRLTASLSNGQNGRAVAPEQPVRCWKGRLAAPTVTVDIPASRNQQPGRPVARPEDQAMGALETFLGALASRDFKTAYGLVAPSSKEHGDPIAYGASLDYKAFLSELSPHVSADGALPGRLRKFMEYKLGARRWESPSRYRILVTFQGWDNDEVLLVREEDSWYVADPIHIIR